LDETKVCNAHKCADTSTVAGGFTFNGPDKLVKLGLGFVDLYSSPDLKYNPRSISALRHKNTDILFLSGDPTASARIRRVDVRPSTGNCAVATDSSSPPTHAQECRTLQSAGVALEARVAGVIGTPLHYSTTALTAVSEEKLYLFADNKLALMELVLTVPCASWIGVDMMGWSFATSKATSEESHPIELELDPEYGMMSRWEFGGYRQRKTFVYAGQQQGDFQKNTMCMQQLPGGVRSCCTYKEVPELEAFEGAAQCARDRDAKEKLDCAKIESDMLSRKNNMLNQIKFF